MSCLFGLLRPGDHLLSAAGAPYDTMETVIGLAGNAPGNLREMGVSYSQAEMAEDQTKLDVPGVLSAIRETGLLSPETDEKLKAALESFTKDFLKTKK